MKKFYFILAAAAMFLAVDANAQLGVGIGYNHLNNVTRLADEKDNEGLDGFYVEATYDWNFLDKGWGSLGLQPGLRYTFAGESDSDEVLGVVTREAIAEHYLDVPVNVKYSYDLGSVKLSAFVGPVFSFGLSSVNKVSADDYVMKYYNYTGKTVTKGSGSSSAVKPEGDPAYGRFDLKLGVGVGATFLENLNVKLGYNFGMLNRYTGPKSDNFKSSIHTGVFYVGVGFNF